MLSGLTCSISAWLSTFPSLLTIWRLAAGLKSNADFARPMNDSAVWQIEHIKAIKAIATAQEIGGFQRCLHVIINLKIVFKPVSVEMVNTVMFLLQYKDYLTPKTLFRRCFMVIWLTAKSNHSPQTQDIWLYRGCFPLYYLIWHPKLLTGPQDTLTALRGKINPPN